MIQTSETVEDTTNSVMTDVTDDSCVMEFIEIVPLETASDYYHTPEFIDTVVQVQPEDLQDDHRTLDFIYPVVEVKPEDMQDVKQEADVEYEGDDPQCSVKVRF